MIEEEWDEHFKVSAGRPLLLFLGITTQTQTFPLIFKVTCEYGYDFWKTVTFKPFDVE